MDSHHLLNQFLGTQTPSSNSPVQAKQPGFGDVFSQVSSRLPDGFAGGAAAGGIIALLIGSKTGRKFASKVVTYGGATLLGPVNTNPIRPAVAVFATSKAE